MHVEKGDPAVELKVFLRTLVRRWYLMIVIAALVGVVTSLVVDRVGPTYESTGSILVFPPTQSEAKGTEVETQGNPYLELTGLTQARDIAIRTLTSKTTRDELDEQFPGMTFDATPDFTNSAPIVLFTVQATTAQQSVAALQELMDRVPSTLATLQAGLELPDTSKITSMPLTQDERPDVVRKSQLRAAILAAAVTIVLGLLLLALADSLLAARRRAQQRNAVPEPSDDHEPAPDPDDADDAAAPVPDKPWLKPAREKQKQRTGKEAS